VKVKIVGYSFGWRYGTVTFQVGGAPLFLFLFCFTTGPTHPTLPNLPIQRQMDLILVIATISVYASSDRQSSFANPASVHTQNASYCSVGSVPLALCARRMVNRSAGANNSNCYSMWESGSCQDCMKRLMQLGVPLHGTPLLKLTPYFSFYSLTNTGARFDL